jgi:hypothetical protein
MRLFEELESFEIIIGQFGSTPGEEFENCGCIVGI